MIPPGNRRTHNLGDGLTQSTQTLVADIGGTHTRCGTYEPGSRVDNVLTFPNQEFSDVADCIDHYCHQVGIAPDIAALGVAAPITDDHVQLSNSNWGFSRTELQRKLALERLEVINDFTALAHALPSLSSQDVVEIGAGTAKPDSPKGVIGPGTGLGVSGLVRSGLGWTAIIGEGGHVDLAATTPEEVEIVSILIKKYGHCSAERVLSGSGLVNLYHAKQQLIGKAPTAIEPWEITGRAIEQDKDCMAVMRLFFAFLGSAAGNLALLLGAHGGIYIGGGIAPKNLALINDSPFREKFESKGRFRGYLQRIPTYVITNPTPALTGLKSYLIQLQGDV